MKGWTVRTQATKNGSKGVASREVYLTNSKHPNHRYTEQIKSIFGNDRTMSNIAYAAESYVARKAANGKGGRPINSYAIEFTLNLPKGYRPNHEQWRKIVEHCLKETAKACGIEPKQLASTSRAILHQQTQDVSKQGTGDHCHIVIGKFCSDGTYLRNLQRKTATARMKQAFNQSVKHFCGYDWTEYRDHKLQAQKYANKQAVPTWKVKAAREHEQLIEQLAELEMQQDNLLVNQAYLDIQQSNFQALDKFKNQAEKWLKAFDESDQKQLNRQFNRMTKSVEEVRGFSSSLTDEELDYMNKITSKVNQNSPKNLPKIKR